MPKRKVQSQNMCMICEGEGDLQFVCGLYCVSLEHLHIQLLVLYCYY